MVSRVVLVTLLLGTLIIFQHEYRIYPYPASFLYKFILFVYALTGIYRLLLHKLKNLVFFSYLQISSDIFLVTFLVHFTGGIDSSLLPLYHLTIISTSVIIDRRGGYLAASLAAFSMAECSTCSTIMCPDLPGAGIFRRCRCCTWSLLIFFPFTALLFERLSGRQAKKDTPGASEKKR